MAQVYTSLHARRSSTRRSSRTRGCRPTTTSLSLAAPAIAALASPGQFVMVKPRAGMRSAVAASVLDFRGPARRVRRAHRHLDPQQANRRRHRAAVRSRTGGTRRCARPARASLRTGRAAGGSVDGRRRRRPGAVPHAGGGATRGGHAVDAVLRRAPCGRSCIAWRHSSGSASASVLATEDGSRGVARLHHGSRSARHWCASSRTAAPLRPSGQRQAVRVRTDADDAGGCATWPLPTRPCLRRLARTDHGLRPGRLLQLRRAWRATAPERRTSYRSCIDGPVFDATRIVWEALAH